MRRYHMMGVCHIDVCWHGDEQQYADYLEQFTVVLVDLLKQNPDMTYMIEQAYHYRKLKERRPDLVEELTKLIRAGRIEVVGGMLSTADTNLPNSECIVRNQLMGLQWFKKEMDADVETAWLVDTFGSHAQIPQMLGSFKMKQMMTTRMGGNKYDDYFLAEGLDGSKLLVAGHDTFSMNMCDADKRRVFIDFENSGELVEKMFDRFRQSEVDGPLMLNVMMEDETYPTRRIALRLKEMKEWAKQNGDEAVHSLPRDFFNELREYNEEMPVESADFNPEFTGTYSQRVEIRLQNRKTEAALLDAELWHALKGKPYGDKFDECWWDMSFVHFHDVFSGSHPEVTFLDVLNRLAKVKKLSEETMTELFGSEKTCEAKTLKIANSLPYARKEWIGFQSPAPRKVTGKHGEAKAYWTNGTQWFFVEVDACATAVYSIAEAPDQEGFVHETTLENEFIRLNVDAKKGVTLVEKKTGRTVLNRARDLLVLQKDIGNFQIEQIEENEQYAWNASVKVERLDAYRVAASGIFGTEAAWTLTFTVRPGEPMMGLHVHTDWHAVGKRLRLKLNTTLVGAGEGIFEVPFGVVRRRPYTPTTNCKGEWPAQRFVAVEDAQIGVGLINDGVPGVETLGGSIYTTLLRAPVQIYAGMVPDKSSLQDGKHDFSFAVLAYNGKWEESDLLRMGQRWNTPLRLYAASSGDEEEASLFKVDSPTVLLSTVKESIAYDKTIVIRLTESVGKPETFAITLPGMKRVYAANMLEEKQEELPAQDGKLVLDFAPWQIRTILVEKE